MGGHKAGPDGLRTVWLWGLAKTRGKGLQG